MPPAILLDGKKTATRLYEDLRQEVQHLPQEARPKLTAILVGNNPASEIYVSRKMKTAVEIGIHSDCLRLPLSISEAALLDEIARLNADKTVHAILVQLPLPQSINAYRILEAILPQKDVDGFHPENVGKLVLGMEPWSWPCTPKGIMTLLEHYQLSPTGHHAVVVGRSNIVGKPLALMLLQQHATVTICHSKTQNLEELLRSADILVAAAGQPGLVRAEVVKPGAIVVDVGINRLPSGKLMGDVDFEALQHRAGYITPVPGGVGPMTIATLMTNTLRLYKMQQKVLDNLVKVSG